MAQEKLSYRDSRNYVAIDAAKGIDLITKQIVMADTPAPEGYPRLPKCKFCKNFTGSKEENLGFCEAAKDRFPAYPDMIAVTCEQYQEP